MKNTKIAMVATALAISAMGQPSFEWPSSQFKPVEPWRSRRKGGKGRRTK